MFVYYLTNIHPNKLNVHRWSQQTPRKITIVIVVCWLLLLLLLLRAALAGAPTDDRSKALHWAAGGRRGLSEYIKGRLLTPAGQALATGGAAAVKALRKVHPKVHSEHQEAKGPKGPTF